jgi:putative intracellular protease/amidase
MTGIVHLYVCDTFADWEPGFATAHIRRASWQREPGRYDVRTVADSLEPVTSMGGVRVQPDLTVDQLDPHDSAMLMLVGGDTWADREKHHAILERARAFLDAGTPVAAICGATYGLALAGLLDDRAHTSNAAVYLQQSGYAGAGRYVDAPAVTDRGLITATGTKPVDFAKHVFAALDLYEPHVLESWYGLYSDGDPKYFYELMAVA